MMKDINMPEVVGVELAIVRKEEAWDMAWYVYILNNNKHPLEHVMVTSKGYGKKNGEMQKTSVLRHVIGRIDAQSHALIELIHPALFHLNNEFWVNYYMQDELYDKKFVFLPDSIKRENMHTIRELGLSGVLHA